MATDNDSLRYTSPTGEFVPAPTVTPGDLQQNLALFMTEAWQVLQPNRKFVWSWHYELLCEYLTMVKERKVRRLIINVPPRTAKSTIATICFPCWVWTTQPQHCFLCASYSKDLSTEHSLARRNLINSEWYQHRWEKGFRLASDQNQKSQFDNTSRGQMIATSVGGTITGKGGDTLIVDDPLSADQALSEAERHTANQWFDNTLRTRLNNPDSGAILIIMQRLHERDLTGFLLEQEPDTWTHIRLPLVAEKDEEWIFPMSKKRCTRKEGQVLQPERFPPDVVETLRKRRLMFAGQFQQSPAPLAGNIIKRADVRYYGGIDPVTGEADVSLPDEFDMKVLSVDCSFKGTEDSDFVAIGVIGVKENKRYILNVVNQRLGMMATEKELRRQRKLYRTISAILVEDTANGPAIIERLKHNVSGVIAIDPRGGKLARLYAASGEWEAGDWYVDRNAAWTEPFLEQITKFPNATSDDMVDMMSQTAVWLQARNIGLFEHWRTHTKAAGKAKVREN